MTTTLRRVLTTTSLGALACVAAPNAAHAAYPGVNGPVLYTQFTDYTTRKDQLDVRGDLRTVGVDGVGLPSLFATKQDEHGGSISPNGTQLVFVRSNTVWIGDREGQAAQRLTPPDDETYEDLPEFSPDGKRVLYSEFAQGILATDFQGSAWAAPKVLVPGVSTRKRTVQLLQPRLTPDGSKLLYVRIAFTSKSSKVGDVKVDDPELWIANADGSAPRRLIKPSGSQRAIWSYDISPDGTRVIYGASSNGKGFPTRLVIAGIDGTGARVVAKTDPKKATFGGVAWAPDGTTIAITQNGKRRATRGQLDLLDPTTGARRTLVRAAKAWIEAPVFTRAAAAQ